MKTVSTKIKVRYVETDMMGIVHHSNYFAWFELARGEFVQTMDMTYKQMESLGIMTPLVESYCKYISGAYYDDELSVSCTLKELTRVKVSFDYVVINVHNDKLIAEAWTKHVFVDSEHKIINLAKTHPEIWSIFVKNQPVKSEKISL